MTLRIPGPEANAIAERLASGIEHAEFTIPGQMVADIKLRREPSARPDGSVELDFEALTIEE